MLNRIRKFLSFLSGEVNPEKKRKELEQWEVDRKESFLAEWNRSQEPEAETTYERAVRV